MTNPTDTLASTVWSIIKAKPGSDSNDVRVALGGDFVADMADSRVVAALGRLHEMGIVTRWREPRPTLSASSDARYSTKIMYCYALVADKAESYDEARKIALAKRKQVSVKRTSRVHHSPPAKTKRQPVEMSKPAALPIDLVEPTNDLPIDVESLTIDQESRLLGIS